MVSTKEITESLDREFPYDKKEFIANSADFESNPKFLAINQFIIGVTEDEMHNSGIRTYKQQKQTQFGQYGANVICRPWPFYEHEQKEAIEVLNGLAIHYEIKLNAEKMIDSLRIKNNSGKMYYIVVTIAQSPILVFD